VTILASALNGNDLVGLVIAVLLTAFLVYALLAPEKL
jgi:K+-transporting ATPase KdpF subunit